MIRVFIKISIISLINIFDTWSLNDLGNPGSIFTQVRQSDDFEFWIGTFSSFDSSTNEVFYTGGSSVSCVKAKSGFFQIEETTKYQKMVNYTWQQQVKILVLTFWCKSVTIRLMLHLMFSATFLPLFLPSQHGLLPTLPLLIRIFIYHSWICDCYGEL